ncbi:Uncharacterised protein [Mycobacteroides abscessus subsp. massiliense]|nr:Uncharacterised protein [Mycobacteroides abscessus subsp. massiliense]
MELGEGGGLVKEVERRCGDHRIQCAVVERQLFGRRELPVDQRGTGLRLGEHPLGHVDPVHLLGLEFFLDACRQNAGTAGDIDNTLRLVLTQQGDHLVLCRAVHPLL